MRTFQRTLLAGAVALALSTPAVAQFTGAYFFGDSLSDSGNYKPLLPPGTGLFTTNPGPVWPTVFAGYLGLTAIPSIQPGGTNYAYGGARVTDLPGVLDPPLPATAAIPIATQVQQYLAKGPIDPNAIYSINGGGNDMLWQLGLAAVGLATPEQVQAALAASATNLGKQVAILNAAGARYVMIWNLPDVGRTPYAVGSGLAPTVSALSSFYNATLQATLDAVGGQQIRLNSFLLLNEVLANPGAYGLKNATSPGCTISTAYLCTPLTLVTPDAAQTYFWSNNSHPTTAVHQIIADYAISFLEGPQQMGSLAEAPLRAEDASYRALDNRMWSSLNAPRTEKRLEAWAAYDYASIDMNAGPNNASGNANTVAVGGDMKLSDRLLAGMMFTYVENKTDFDGAGGGFKLRQPIFTLYGGYGEGPWYLGATLGAGSLDYTGINRNINLGPLVRNESGQTRGYEYTGRLLGGYWFKYQDMIHGPYAMGTYTKAIVRQFSEVGADSTALTYDQQSNEQMLWSVGWQVAGKYGNVRPWARATWEYDSLDNDRTVTASSNTLSGSYTVPVTKPDNNYALFNVGAAIDWPGVTGFISGSGTAARGDGNYWAITVGLRMPL